MRKPAIGYFVALLLAVVFLVPIGACRTIAEKPAFKLNVAYEPPRGAGPKSAAMPGRYIGYFRPDQSAFKIPMTLDLIEVTSRNGVTRYQGFSKLSTENFIGSEFRVDYHSQITFNHENQAFSSAASDGQLSLSDAQLKAKSIITGKMRDSGREVGDFLVIYAGNRRAINIETLLAKVFPERSIFPALAGSYTGTCDEQVAKLDVATTRWNFRSEKGNGFLSQVRMQAQLGVNNYRQCGEGIICGKSFYQSGSLNIERSKLALGTGRERIECDINAGKIGCDNGCVFKADNAVAVPVLDTVKLVAKRQERKDHVDLASDGILRRSIDFEGAIAGEYFGYLFNETTLRYQLFRLKVDASMAKEEGMTQASVLVSGIGTLFWGGADTNEFSVNRFESEYYAETGPNFIFAGTGDLVVQVGKWGREGMKAILYSKAFGRVGTLELSRNRVPPMPMAAAGIHQLTGIYASKNQRFTLLAQPNVSEYSQDFFPLSARGFSQDVANPNQKYIITDVSVDSYSGQFSMLLGDGRLVVGTDSTFGAELFWRNSFVVGQPLVVPQRSVFQFTRESTPGKTASTVLDVLQGQKSSAL